LEISSHFKRFLSANFLVAVFGVMAGVILARNLTVENRGELAEVLLWVSLGVTIGSESIREYLFSLKKNKNKISQQILLFASLITIILPLFLLLDNGYQEYLGYSLLFSILNIFSITYLAKVQINGSFGLLSFYKVIVPLINLIILSTTFFYELGVWFALFSLLAANAILLLILFSRESFVEFINTGGISDYVNVLFSIIVIVTINQMDRIVIAKVASAEEMAYFVISLTIIATPLTIIGQTISSYLVIDIKKKKFGFSRYIDHKMVITLIILSAIASVIYFFLSWIISTVFGDKYLPALTYGLLCACLSIFSNIRALYNYALRGLGLNKLVSLLQFFMLFSLAITYFVNINVDLDVNSLLWLLISIQLIFFVCFYIFIRQFYLSSYQLLNE
jgi:O-antigen/teichoic acid export membrane protein